MSGGSRTHTVQVTRQMLVRYAGASGDFNPIHFSDHYATRLGQVGVIAHGMLTMGLAMQLVSEFAGGPAAVRSCQFRFKRPVPVPDDADGTAVEFDIVPEPVADAAEEGLIRCTLTARIGDTVVGQGRADVVTPVGADA